MSVWREVQETLYQRWADQWVSGGEAYCPFVFEDEGFDPPEALWARFSVKRMPGQQETIGTRGNRKMNRVGMVFIQLQTPPGAGVGLLSDAGEFAASIFENERLTPYDIRFNEVEPGESGDIDKGRWRGLVVQGRFEYVQIK